ncbi:hypothetical protein SAMN02910384_01398 [Pseudobutyrivibrio sp. ACV-2]|uniref:C-glycoside deglycosidase beta subunit domain-containing protein n=1 Tax=Pseudobutyrivibrio sp. ACV-2 TaxID=1520801 RepID=UPI000894A926|nr:DUF6379 domain-containing protein [Pseudobutyrivibrio sp. ACV-2]SEA38611.1 hypothetical protein SAMN02910384_01398 [Pseudobutyrivibrio sp. ACV-2]
MAGRPIYDPASFKNVEENGKVVGFSFAWKAQYYRSFTLSILRDIILKVDGEDIKREDIRLTVNGDTFTLEECRTVIDPEYRWEFGEYATVTVLKEGGLSNGKHSIEAIQKIAPSYMPFVIEAPCNIEFEI